MPRRSAARSQTRKVAKRNGFRSGLEYEVAQYLLREGRDAEYEPKDCRVQYQPPARKYVPDFVLPNGTILEVKGRLTQADRAKHLLIKSQHPELDVRFVFKIDNKINKNSETRYSDWCEKHGFLYCFIEEGIPDDWFS